MNKIINKALFYKEWINVRWITLLTIVILLFFKVYGFISILNENERYMNHQGGFNNNVWFNNGLYVMQAYYYVMIFVVILLAIILFAGDKNSETQGFIASMPFTRKEIILNKWIIGVLSLLISFIISYILFSLFYVVNINVLNTALNPYSDIAKWFFMDTLQYVCIFTFMVLAQAVMGNSVVSGIVGGLILIVPWFITMVIQDLFMRDHNLSDYTYSIFGNIGDWSNIYSYNLAVRNGLITDPPYYYNYYGLKLLVLFILTFLFLYLAYVSFKKRNLEYNLSLIVFKNLELVFVWGFAVCLGVFAGFASDCDLNLSFILFVVFTIIGYFISKLLLKIFSTAK